MLNSKDVKDSIMQLLPEQDQERFESNGGVLTGLRLHFDKVKLEENMQEVATILKELGIDKHPVTSLAGLTTYENGEVWNELQNAEDFQALELILACSDACGFIHNNGTAIERNLNEIGEMNAILISNCGRAMIADDKRWTRLIRERVADRMLFLTEPELIKTYAPSSNMVAAQR